MIDLPNEVSENGFATREKAALNKVIRYLRKTRMIENPTVSIEQTTHGSIIHAKAGTTTTSDTTAPRWG
jgi:hypothetical protein